MNLRRTIVMAALMTLGSLSAPARAQFQELAARVPDTANALALFNVRQAGERSQALRANWSKEREAAFRAGRVLLPPGASRCVAASQLDFGSMRPVWEITLVDYEQEPDLASIARQNQSPLESISGAPSIAVSDDLYLVQLGPERLAALSPGGRQEVSRWIKRTAAKKDVTLSPYLQSALQYEEGGADIIVALDLEDAVAADRIREVLAASPTIKGRKLDVERVAKLLEGIHGLMLAVRTGEQTSGKLRVDFRGDASLLDDAAKPLLLELLSKTGAMIDDFNSWTAVVEKRRVSLEGPLSPSGLRRVTSILEPSSFAMREAAPSAGASSDGATPKPAKSASETKLDKTPSSSEAAQASRQYFRSIQTLLDDLHADVKSSVTIGQAGVWLQKYAQRINRLPELNVDHDALNYGAYVSQELLEASTAVKGVGIKSGARRAAVFDSGYEYYDRFGAAAARRQVNAEARAAGATSAVDIMNEITKASGQVRRTLTQRYMMEF